MSPLVRRPVPLPPPPPAPTLNDTLYRGPCRVANLSPGQPPSEIFEILTEPLILKSGYDPLWK